MTEDHKKKPPLDALILRIVRSRLFLPLFILSIVVIASAGYWSLITIGAQQQEIADAQARIVDRYLDQAGRTLESISIAAETASPDTLATVLDSSWKAYKHFDTLYYLDSSSRIRMMVPSDLRYLGLDMSGMHYFEPADSSKGIAISQPFISLRTGYPTVYIIHDIQDGGAIVGELSLLSLQNEVAGLTGKDENDFFFIVDEFGTLLVHPSVSMVREQTNLANLEIFRQSGTEQKPLVYDYFDTKVIGSAAPVKNVNWLVINQIPLSTAVAPYIWAFAILFAASLIIWFLLVWEIRREIRLKVVMPFEKLSRGSDALKQGDFSHARELATIDATFAELDQLANDFRFMSTALQERETELHAANQEMTATAEELKQNYDELERSQSALQQARRKLSLLNTVTFTDIQNAIFSLSGYLELEEMEQKEHKSTNYLEREIAIVRSVENSLNFAKRYQNLGIKPPSWQNVEQTFLLGISHLKMSDINRRLDVDELEIYADPMLENVFFTLAENVIIHGKGADEISLHYTETPNHLVLIFEDNGAGIPDEMKEKIFDRIYEEKKGMGLFLSRESLSVTGITIKETGTEGKGAMFEIHVPKGGYRFRQKNN